MKYSINMRGFTLVELLTVISVLGVLVIVFVSVLNPGGQINKAHDAQRKNDIKQISTALELYRNTNGKYPSSSPGATWITCTSALSSLLTPQYAQKLPSDPKGAGYPCYVYAVNGAQTTYTLYAKLENCSDADANSSSKPSPYVLVGSAGSTTCGSSYTFSGSDYTFWINNP